MSFEANMTQSGDFNAQLDPFRIHVDPMVEKVTITYKNGQYTCDKTWEQIDKIRTKGKLGVLYVQAFDLRCLGVLAISASGATCTYFHKEGQNAYFDTYYILASGVVGFSSVTVRVDQ